MNKAIAAALGVIIVAVLGALFFRGNEPTVTEKRIAGEEKLRVIATFYPLAEFSRMAGGEAVEVSSIVSPGIEPHEYEPTPRDIISLEQADIFVMNGAGMEPWAERLAPGLREKGVIILNASESVLLLAAEEHEEEIGHEQEAEQGGAYDPHFWLDPVFAAGIVDSIRGALIEKDPAHAAEYEASVTWALSGLAALDAEYRSTLSSCTRHEVITSHNAFAYLSRRYGFTAHSISGISPETEPSAGRMADLVDLAEKENIRYIFFETLVSPKVSETLAREIGAETLVFDPIEGLSPEDAALGKDYFSVMRENLANLSKALECGT